MLANRNGPMGFRIFQTKTPHPKTRSRDTVASMPHDLMVGDAYTVDANGAIDDRAAAGEVVRGIVMGFEIEPIAAYPQGPLSKDYIPSGTGGKVIGCEDPEAIFVVQATTFALSNSIQMADLLDANGDTGLRQSRQELDDGTFGSGTQFQIMGLAPSPADNAVGAYAKVLVKLATPF